MCACPGTHKPLGSHPTCEDACFGPGAGPRGPAIDYGAIEAQRRAAQAAEAERARQQREDEERERQAAERRWREQAERDAAAKALRGGSGRSPAGESGLRGSSPGQLQLREASREPPAVQAAWRQLHCAAVILAPALIAVGKDPAEFNFLSNEAAKALAGKAVAVDCGKPPAGPPLGEADYERLRQAARGILERAAALRPGEAKAELDRYAAATTALQAGDAGPMLALRIGAELRPVDVQNRAAEKKRLTVQEKDLAARIERDIIAIRRLGFDRRAEDFAEWESLGKDAKAQFEKEVIDAATDTVAGKVGDNLLKSFSRFDMAKAGRWLKLLEKVEPRPVELIALINKVAAAGNKAQMTNEAALILQGIERIQSAQAAQGRDELLLLGLDLMCDVVPPPGDAHCSAFKTVGKLTAASLYNNAARRVAVNEVDRLTRMTESQLKALARLNELLTRHVKERNEVRAKLRELE